ncbi:MAG: RNA polymerase sigma factor [Acidobacteria bacterium]|nr:RNA polymerase sigma factor [Acidobacteriota bacterium]
MDDERLEEFELRLGESSTLAFRVAWSVLRQRESAEDVAQEALVRAYRRFHQLRDRTRFRAWLVRMAWRLAIDEQRASRRRAAREHVVAVEQRASASCDAAQHSDEVERLWRAIDALPDKLRWPVVLGAIEGHDTRELAALLGVPEGTIKSRLFLARRRLKELLQ